MTDRLNTSPRAHRWSIVVRLTLLWALLFTTTTGLVVWGTYALVARSVVGAPDADDPPPPEFDALRQRLGDAAVRDFVTATDAAREDVLSTLRHRSIVVFLLGIVGSTFAAWLLARRSIAPVRQLTAAAQTIRANNLSQRIALVGPNDELKGLADTLDSMLDRIEQSFDSQRLFAAHAAHELRTPIAAVRAEAEMALSGANVVDPTRLAEIAVQQIDRADRLLSSLLALARAEGGAVGTEPIDLADLVGDIVVDAAPAADAAGVTLDLEVETAFVRGDAPLLRSLAINLVSNAIAYNHAGGSVTVRVGRNGPASELVVTNTGRQLTPEEVAALIRPFARAEAERQWVSGSGIGMAVVQAIAKAHQAQFDAHPRPGGGLIAVVRFLPL